MTCWMLSLLFLHAAPALERVERQLLAMGTRLSIVVEAADRDVAVAASERAAAAVEETEARLSTWRDDTELARFHRAPVGEPVRLSPRLHRELEAAAACHRRTGGAFDPGIGALVEAWGLRRGGRLPAPGERAASLAAGGLEALRLDGDGHATRLRPGLVIEEGGFGKGAALDRALEELERAPGVERAYLDLGGQAIVHGRGGFRVPVADPRRRDRAAVEIELERGSLATSGNGERGIVVGGRRYGHLLDPRTGEPAPDFGSLTVLAPSALEADCLATGLYVLGPDAALAWAAAREGIEALVLEVRGDGLSARATAGLAGRLHPRLAGLEIDFHESL